MTRLLCILGSHRWSCVGKSGYYVCDGHHHCIHCGYAPNNPTLAEQGRRLAGEREDLIAQGVDPADLVVPLYPSPGGTAMTTREPGGETLEARLADALPDCFADEQPDWWYRDTAAHLAGALAPVVAARVEAAVEAALTAAANDWQHGEWANAPRVANRIQERIANAQFVTDWLRDRAAAIAGGQP